MKLIFSSMMIVLSLNAFAESKMEKKMDTMTESTQLDDLIRGEMAAVKSYNQILGDIKDRNEKLKLEKIKNDHVVAVSKLKTFANKEVKEDTTTAGVWGTFSEAWTGGAKLMGNEMALKALSQGEKHGIDEYIEALDDKNVKPELKQMIRTQFIPKQEEHLKTIKSFM